MELPRGMKDFEADEISKIELVRTRFIELSNLYGFSFMEPSPLELLSTLETKSGPGIKNEIYYFEDKGQREVALRFDFTMGVTRYAISQKSIKLPAKFSSFGGVFRYDEPQKGRYRYFHQWDIEVYGKQSLESEAEIIEFTSHFFESLNLSNITIDMNHRNLVQSYITKIFSSNQEELTDDILRAIDKTQKKSNTEIIQEFSKKGYPEEKLKVILEFSKLCGSPEEIESKFNVTDLDSWNEIKQLFSSLSNRGVHNIRINFGIVRGLDYYSGIVFEVFDKTSNFGALAGGGRYDTLTAAFGRDDLGATGVAGGVERIILTMMDQGILNTIKKLKTFVLYTNETMQQQAIKITSNLRRKNIPVEIDLIGKSLKKQMDYASNADFVIIVGAKEFADNKITLRDMRNGQQNQISIDSLLSDPTSFLV